MKSPGLRAGTLMAGATVVILVAGCAGLALGSHHVPVGTVIEALTRYDPTNDDHLIVVASRLPRTVLGILVGAALGLAGALMQSVTRNPLADPGILGINAGASAAVVIAIAYLGAQGIETYLWYSFAGAALVAVGVYALGTGRRGGATPAKMALAGAAIATAITALTSMVLLSNEPAFTQFRYWAVGSLQGRGLDISLTVLPFIVVGIVLALLLARGLNALALGEEAARGIGSHTGLTRAGSALCVVLLAGAATAAAGPIGFIGLAAPHLVRGIVGPDHRVLLPCVLLIAPAFLLAADVAGRLAVAPDELQTGIAAAILGGPLFIMLVRSRRVVGL